MSGRRRQFLTLLAAGATGLAGCSSISGIDTNSTDTTDNSTDDKQPPQDGEVPRFTPERSQFVTDGQLNVRPFVEVFGFTSIRGQTTDLIMTAMPDPLGDYEITAYYTPLSTVDTEWNTNFVRSTLYGGITPEYNEETNTWDASGRAPVTTIREAKSTGVEIGTITVPSAAAGIMAHDVPNPYNRDDINFEITDDDVIEFADDASERRFETWVDENIPAQGSRYTDFIGSVIDSEAGLRRLFGDNVGSWISGTGPITPPFVKEFEFSLSDDQLAELGITRYRDNGFPAQEPFVLTFTVDDPNAAHNDPEQIVTQTPTAIPGPERFRLYTPDVRVPDDSAETWLQKNWERHITRGDDWERTEADDIHREFDYEDTPEVTTAKVSRLTSYGRFSPKMERYSERLIESSTSQTRAPEQFLPIRPPAYLDSPIQAAWTIEYDVAKSQIGPAQQKASEVKSFESLSGQYIELANEAQTYETIQNIIQQLRAACDNIGTETPTEEVRVVADFVAHLEHIALDSNPPGKLDGFGTPGPQHPLWTLYHQTGDCQDFAVLANTILSSDAFGYSPRVAVADSLAFSRNGSTVTHVSSSVPMSDLEIDDVQDDALIEFETEGRVLIQEGLQYMYNGEKYAYVEMSAPFPIGTTYGRRTRTASPEPLETWTF